MARPSRPQRDRKVQPPRPPNAWILYRSHQFKQIRETHERLSQAAISKIISDMWKHETDEVKRHFEQEAETRKAQHQEQYPDYRFCPKRKETKQSSKRSKTRGTTPSDAGEDVNKDDDDDNDAPPPVPTFPVMSYLYPQPQSQPPSVPVYHHNLAMPQPFLIPYLPGPGGLSPMSAAPSPAPHVGSESPLQPRLAGSSSSSPSNRSSPSSSSQASSSSQLSSNTTQSTSLPTSHHPSPYPYATLPLPTLLTSDELSPTPPRLQLRSAENIVTPVVPAWDNVSTYLPTPVSPNSEEVVNLNLAITQSQTYTELEQVMSPGSSYDPLQGLLSRTDESGVFNLSNIEPSALLSHPRGDLEVAMGPQAEIVDYSDDFFADFDFDQFQRQMDSVTEDGSTSATVASHLIPEDLRSLFHTPNNPEHQVYSAPRQRQPSAFTQDMMNFLNFEAMEGSTEDAAPTVSPGPAPTTVAPQQVYFQSPQVVPAMPIFTQMTNVPAAASGSSYVPPAGAIYSSMRRVGGSWKPSFAVPCLQMDESVPSWSL